MGKNPAFQFYPGDWSRDLEEHSLEIEGAWIRICCKLWWSESRGELKRTLCQWAKILRLDEPGAKRILDYICAWKIGDISYNGNGEITVISRRMQRDEKDRENNAERQRRFKDKNKDNAKGNARVTRRSQRSSSSSSSSSSVFFIKFWNTYPKKKSKGTAEKAFSKINPDEQLLATMIAKIERAKKSDDWLKDDGQYIPHPATWLHARGWEDEEAETDEDRLRKLAERKMKEAQQ